MSRIISCSMWGLALAAITAFSVIPASAASINGGGISSAHIVLVRGGGGGGGGHGGGGFSGGGHGGGGFSGGGHSFGGGGFSPAISGGASHSFSGGASHAFNGGARSFNSNAGNFANGSRSSFYNGGVGHDGFAHGGWNNGNWAWHGNGNYYRGWSGWWGWGYPIAAWLGSYGGGYPGYYYDYGAYPYDDYGDNYAYPVNTVPQPYAAVQPEQNNQVADQGGSEYLDQAVQDFQAGNYQNAMRMAEHAIVDSPRNAEAHEVVSLAAMANKDYRTAATEAHAVIALGGVPSWSQVYAIYQNADAYTSQLRALEDYVKANPKSAEGQFLLGVQYMSTGYSNEAQEHLALAAQMTPKDKIAQDLAKGANGEQP